jgi:hypothetical protein
MGQQQRQMGGDAMKECQQHWQVLLLLLLGLTLKTRSSVGVRVLKSAQNCCFWVQGEIEYGVGSTNVSVAPLVRLVAWVHP